MLFFTILLSIQDIRQKYDTCECQNNTTLSFII